MRSGARTGSVTIKVGPTGELGLFAHFAHLDLSGESEANAQRLLRERARMSLELAYRSKPDSAPTISRQGSNEAGQVREQPPPFPQSPSTTSRRSTPTSSAARACLPSCAACSLAGQGPAVLTQAITGLGGIGKSQTARAYAYRHLADYDLGLVAARRDPGHPGRRLRHPRRPARPRSRHRRPGAADRRNPAAAPGHDRLAPGVRQCRGPGAAPGLAARHRRRPRPDHLAPHRLARPRQGAAASS